MRSLDETDLEIVRLLLADGRRPYREIAAHVGLSPPAISDRIDRLEAQGIIRGFTIDLDRTHLGGGLSVLLTIESEPGKSEAIYRAIRSLDRVEFVSRGHDGSIHAFATVPAGSVDDWLRDALDVEGIVDRDVSLIADRERSSTVSVADFSLTCPVCDSPVEEGGETAKIGGEIHAFCCPTCRRSFEETYERHATGAGED